MIKYLLLFILFNGLALGVSAAPVDTAVVFFNHSGQTVRTLDSADYYMLILPPTPPDDHYNIQEFYKNGQVKLIGKGDAKENSMRTGMVRLDGNCTTYYPDGNKSAVIKYVGGYKDGPEYLYYPSGAELSLIKHQTAGTHIYDETFYWDCYDDKGNLICKGGNGMWVNYDDSGKYIHVQGQVKNGYMEGDWSGKIFVPDTIKYTYHYKRSVIQSSVGYDKNGKSYPFGSEYELAKYGGGWLTFIERLRNRIKLPKDTNGLKMSIDTVHISFTVEKDGKLSQFGISGNIALRLKEAVFDALAKSNEWIPSKIYGVPFRTQVILPLSEISGYKDNYVGRQYRGSTYQKEIWYKEKIIKDN
jgi:antitoxin component YwqK of YwqJK toxin-antitoxin module